MGSNGLVPFAKKLGGSISKNSPTILTCLAVGGVVTTVIFAVKATPKACSLIESVREYKFNNAEGVYHEATPLTKREILSIVWKCYIPAACIGAATIACIIGSNSINQKRNAALATVYGLTEIAFSEYKDKVIEAVGKNKEQKIRDDILKDHIEKNPVGRNEVIFTGKGEVLCYDNWSGRYFKSDIEKIRRSINTINEKRIDDMWVSLNDLYYELGLANTKGGELLGWDLDTGGLKVTFGSQLTEEGEPCLIIDFSVEPKYLE